MSMPVECEFAVEQVVGAVRELVCAALEFVPPEPCSEIPNITTEWLNGRAVVESRGVSTPAREACCEDCPDPLFTFVGEQRLVGLCECSCHEGEEDEGRWGVGPGTKRLEDAAVAFQNVVLPYREPAVDIRRERCDD